jgi:hypothetical protein
MEEIWKPVVSREGVMASSNGRVLLPEREAAMPHGGMRRYIPRPTHGTKTKASKAASHVYMGIYARYYGNMKVHRLVCEAFHGPPPFPKAVVIHLDEDATNNRPENLKWGTQKENLNMPKIKAYHRSRTGENNPFLKGRAKF